MNREEVEFLPESLVSCFIDERAVRVLKISPEKLVIRLLDKIEEINLLKLAFYNFKEDKYNEIVVKEFIIAEIIEKEF